MTANLDGNAWGIRNAIELVREIDRDLAERETQYPRLVAKGRMSDQDASYQLGVIRDIRDDLLYAFAPLAEGTIRLCDIRPAPAIGWKAKCQWIKGELDRRKAHSDELITKGRLDPNQAQRSISTMEQLRRLYWEQMFMWEAEPGSGAAAYLEKIKGLGINSAERRELFSGELGKAYRATVRAHVEQLELEAAPAAALL